MNDNQPPGYYTPIDGRIYGPVLKEEPTVTCKYAADATDYNWRNYILSLPSYAVSPDLLLKERMYLKKDFDLKPKYLGENVRGFEVVAVPVATPMQDISVVHPSSTAKLYYIVWNGKLTGPFNPNDTAVPNRPCYDVHPDLELKDKMHEFEDFNFWTKGENTIAFPADMSTGDMVAAGYAVPIKPASLDNAGKKKISRFEYAIMEAADPEGAKDYEPYTEKEEFNQRKESLLKTASQIKTLAGKVEGECDILIAPK